MGLFDWLSGFFALSDTNDIGSDPVSGMNDFLESSTINPANGLPMIGGIGGVDVEGNPYGSDHVSLADCGCSHDHSIFDDSACSNSWDDYGSNI